MAKSIETIPGVSFGSPLKYIVSALGLGFFGISFGASAVRYYEIYLKQDIHVLTNLAWIFGLVLLSFQQILIQKEKRNNKSKRS